MEHLYIGIENKQLYSVYHEPDLLDYDSTGIIMCYPMAREYIRCHKMYVNLAEKLSAIGFHVLRFDYSGTGDSFGDFKSVTLTNCLENIGMAIKELKEACGVRKIILIGARFGATLALLYSKKIKVDIIIALNPIYSGEYYLQDISKAYKNWLNGSFTKKKKLEKNITDGFGFEFSPVLTKEIREISLSEVDFNINVPILLIDNKESVIIKNLPNVSCETTVNKEFWVKGDDEFDKSMLPIAEINIIVDWIQRNAR